MMAAGLPSFSPSADPRARERMSREPSSKYDPNYYAMEIGEYNHAPSVHGQDDTSRAIWVGCQDRVGGWGPPGSGVWSTRFNKR